MSDNPLLMSPLVTSAELAQLLSGNSRPAAAPVLLDVRWTLAGSDRAGYLQAHIPGAHFIDLDQQLAGTAGEGGRHPLPAVSELQAAWRAAGVGDGSTVVVYDGGSGLAAARAWWLLRWSGLRTVRVLDGGFPAWSADARRPLAAGSQVQPRPGTITVTPGSMPVVDVDEAADLATSESGVLLDARAAVRFRGEIEPLDPVAGHIPGAVNLPIAELLEADGTFRSAVDIGAAFGAAGVGPTADALRGTGSPTVAASCGSGVTACQLILAGELAGLELALYAGSYSQWCALGRPIAVGA